MAFQQHITQFGIGKNESKPSPVGPQRFRLQAALSYLQRPLLSEEILPKDVEEYWADAAFCNGMMDKAIGITTVAVIDQIVTSMMERMPRMNAIAERITTQINRALGTHHTLAN